MDTLMARKKHIICYIQYVIFSQLFSYSITCQQQKRWVQDLTQSNWAIKYTNIYVGLIVLNSNAWEFYIAHKQNQALNFVKKLSKLDWTRLESNREIR